MLSEIEKWIEIGSREKYETHSQIIDENEKKKKLTQIARPMDWRSDLKILRIFLISHSKVRFLA